MSTKLNVSRSTVEEHLPEIMRVGLMTPMGDPNEPDCIWGLPCLFWGESGIGKTQRVQQSAKMYDFLCHVVLGSQHPPEDFSGVPVPKQRTPDEIRAGESGLTIECTLSAVHALNKAKGGILMFDELSNCPPATQGAMLTVCTDREIGDTKLHPKVRLWGAANPPEIAAGGWGLEPPMANRWCHFDIGSPAVDDWIKWYTTEGSVRVQSMADVEKQVSDAWPKVYPEVKGLIAGFLHANRTKLHAQPKAGDQAGGREWPSPRTWVMAGRAVATARCLGASELIEQLFVAGCVGQGPAVEFMTFIKNADLPSPDDALRKGWKIDTQRLDRTVAVYTSVQAYIGEIKKRADSSGDRTDLEELGTLAWERLMDLSDSNLTDLMMRFCETMVDSHQLGPTGCKNKKMAKAAGAVLLKIGKSSVGTFAPGARG